MTAARLSPAASLLRNSRLFSIPAALSLPAIEPSSEPTSFSDTATTTYPTRAAIETPLTSLNQGDWGLKRPLPTKTTTKSGTPVIRFRRGIDTPEHVVDFESAAEHVLTLRKYQELRLPLTLPLSPNSKHEAPTSAFDDEIDHTAVQSSTRQGRHALSSWSRSETRSQKDMPQHLRDAMVEIKEEWALQPPSVLPPKTTGAIVDTEKERRWRYTGPFLAGLNGLEFDRFLGGITREKRLAFRQLIDADFTQKRAQAQRQQAFDQGLIDESWEPKPLPPPTQEELAEHLRLLRSDPGKFGPMIAKFFDLADGPKIDSAVNSDPWSYGRDTAAIGLYKENGPPRTHPSAGISYLKTDATALNDVRRGPRSLQTAQVGRLVKSVLDTKGYHPSLGVGGFIATRPPNADLSGSMRIWNFAAMDGGKKFVVQPTTATVAQSGGVHITAHHLKDWKVEDDEPVNGGEQTRPSPESEQLRRTSSRLPRLDRYKVEGDRGRSQPRANVGDEMEEILKQVTRPTN